MKPILFNTEMVKAILEGRKTVTRRAIKIDLGLADTDKNDSNYLYIPDSEGDYHHAVEYCKYQIGDILYVRETFCEVPYEYEHIIIKGEHITFPKIAYKADSKIDYTGIWKPSIHMPKSLARIFLKVIDIRVERLQEITEEEVINEGVKKHSIVDIFYKPKDNVYGEKSRDTPIQAFAELWDSTVRKNDLFRYSWKANPWVYVIIFEKINKYDKRS